MVETRSGRQTNVMDTDAEAHQTPREQSPTSRSAHSDGFRHHRARTSLFRSNPRIVEQPTPVRRASRPSTSAAPTPPASENSYSPYKVNNLLIKSQVCFTAEGPTVLSDMSQYKLELENSFILAGAPDGLHDLLDLSENSANMVFDEKLNDHLFMYLCASTEKKSRANEYVMKYKNSRDGRQAWLAINKACMALTSAKRYNLREKVLNSVIDVKLHPERQFNEFMLLVQQLEEASGHELPQVDLEDYLLGFIRRADSSLYDRVVNKIEDDISQDRFDSIKVCDELSKAYDNSKSKRRERQPSTEGKPREKELAVKSASIKDQGSTKTESPDDKRPKQPCIVCERHTASTTSSTCSRTARRFKRPDRRSSSRRSVMVNNKTIRTPQ